MYPRLTQSLIIHNDHQEQIANTLWHVDLDQECKGWGRVPRTWASYD